MRVQLHTFFGCVPLGFRGLFLTEARGAWVLAGSVAGKRRRLADLQGYKLRAEGARAEGAESGRGRERQACVYITFCSTDLTVTA